MAGQRFTSHYLEDASGPAASFDIFPQANVTLYSRSFIPFIPGLQFMSWRNFVPVAAAANEEIEQARSTMRFVFSRVFGRVN